jgi:hypothetical protein
MPKRPPRKRLRDLVDWITLRMNFNDHTNLLTRTHSNIEARNFAGIGGHANPIADGDVEGIRRVLGFDVTDFFICTM